MTILVWLVLGLIAGWLASLIMGSGGYGLIGDIILGILGAVLGGWLATQLLGIDVTGLNPTSIAVAVVGAIILIVLFRAVTPVPVPGGGSGGAADSTYDDWFYATTTTRGQTEEV